jgi:gp16 family phage-associated protein
MTRPKRPQKQFTPRTPEEAKAWLIQSGVSVSAFARTLGVARNVVYDLLRGRSLGKYGDSHKAAVALGLKESPNSATKLQTSQHPGQ